MDEHSRKGNRRWEGFSSARSVLHGESRRNAVYLGVGVGAVEVCCQAGRSRLTVTQEQRQDTGGICVPMGGDVFSETFK